MRILGIDYGDARVGIAVSDLLGFMAQGVRTIKNRGTEKLLTELKEILDEYKPEKIVIGLPKNMDGRQIRCAWYKPRANRAPIAR